MTLTNKQEAFCREYLIDLNATQAAIRAGYSEKTAKDIACQNLAKLNIQKRIQTLMEVTVLKVKLKFHEFDSIILGCIPLPRQFACSRTPASGSS